MTDTNLRLVLQTFTNLAFGGLIGAAWLTDKVTTEVALIPLLALAGLDVLGRRNENSRSRSSQPPSDEKIRTVLPPPGPTAAALLMALESFKGLLV